MTENKLKQKLKIFIASSSEGLEYARNLEYCLAEWAFPTRWDTVFRPGLTAIENLEKQIPRFDLAVFILTPDDKVTIRGDTYVAPRDNLIFETGLCYGFIDRERTIPVTPRIDNLRLPTDLTGIHRVLYNPPKQTGDENNEINYQMRMVNNEIRQHFRNLAPRNPNPEVSNTSSLSSHNLSPHNPKFKKTKSSLSSQKLVTCNLKESEIIELPPKFQIFIMGTQGVGKTTIAKEILEKTNMRTVQKIDALKYALRSLIIKRNEELENKIGSERTAEITNYLGDSVLLKMTKYCNSDEFKAQNALLLEPIIHTCNDLWDRNIPAIIEGINLPIELLEHNFYGRASHKIFINLYVNNETVLEERLKERGESANYIEEHRNSIKIINDYLKEGYVRVTKDNKPNNVFNLNNEGKTEDIVPKIMKDIRNYLQTL